MIVGTYRDLARLFKRSQDLLGRPEEKNSSIEESIKNTRKRTVLARKALRTRGTPRSDASLPGDDLKTPPIHVAHYFLGTAPIIIELNPDVLTVAPS